MATARQHQINFLLSAQQNGNFSAVFSKAQQDFARLGGEIRALNKLQADISSYQKQQAAAQNTEAKLRSLEKQYGLIQEEIEAAAGSTAGLEREKAKLEQRIADATAALERQNQKLGDTQQRLQDAGVKTADLAGESARLAEKLEGLKSRQEAAASSARSAGQAYLAAAGNAGDFGTRASEAFSAAQQSLAAAGIAKGLHEIKDAYAECVTIAAGFQEGMSNVEALSGSTAQELAALTAKAKELGAETKYTAQQSSEAMGYMAMAGWDAQEMLSGMDGVIDLAAASGEDLQLRL